MEAQASSPSPSTGAASDPTPRVAMACVLTSEVATVLAIMRRNVRWSGVPYDGEEHFDDPLIAGLKSLRRAAATWDPRRWRDVEPLLYLRPFLDLVRSDEAGAHTTGAALSSLHKILSLDLVGPDAPNVAEAMAAVVEAVTGCRFEVTDLASEEAVLARVLQVLLACVRGRAAPVLSNRHVCDIVSTCFDVVQQAGTKGELLQRVSRQTMHEVVRCVFARLSDIDATAIADQQVLDSAVLGGGISDKWFCVLLLSGMFVLRFSYVPLLDTVAYHCRLPFHSYLQEVADDGSVDGGVEIGIPVSDAPIGFRTHFSGALDTQSCLFCMNKMI